MQNDWYQQALTPPDVYEATVKVGLVPSVDHAQVYWEVKDPTNGILLAAGSVHHTNMRGMAAAIEVALQKVRHYLEEQQEPF